LGTKKFLKKVSQAKTTKRLSDIPSNALFPYDNQVKKMHGLILDKGLSFSNSLAFRRDESDRNAGVFCVPYSNNYNPNLIFDHQLKKNEKKREFETFFALEDYVQRKNPKDVRGGLQSKISRLIEDWVDPSIQSKISHKYLVTNEGLGKSTTVLRLGLDPKKFSFIYATYTKKNMDEKSEYLDKLGVPYETILSVETILENEGHKILIPVYNQYFSRTLKPSFRSFLEQQKTLTPSQSNRLLDIYNKNNNLIHENKIILMTTAKLKVMLMINQADILNDNKSIIIDEFVDAEWKRLVGSPPHPLDEPSDDVSLLWDGKTEKHDLYEQTSMFDVINSKNILVLTTERSLVEIYFWGTDFTEMAVEFEELGKVDDNWNWHRREDSYLEVKLEADNVNYLLVKSTSKDKLSDQASWFAGTNARIISDGLKNSGINALTHLGVKGMNNLSDSDTIVFGTQKTEIVLREMFVNNKDYFTALVSHKYKNGGMSDDDIIKKSEPYIQDILIETQVSQSIGRNSGFRFSGKKCVVVLPVVHSNSTRRLSRTLRSNYISENVSVVEFDPLTKEFLKVPKGH
jgi:hypothetical protein